MNVVVIFVFGILTGCLISFFLIYTVELTSPMGGAADTAAGRTTAVPEPFVEIVLAHYREPLHWIDDFEDVNHIKSWHIYSSGNATLPLTTRVHVRSFPENRGREARGYLTHIVENYDQLADIVVFAQAWPFDVNEHFGDSIRCLRKDFQGDFAPLSSKWHQGMHLLDEFSDKYDELWTLLTGSATDEAGVFPNAPGGPFKKGIGRFCCAQFAVKRALIRRHPVEFYRKALDFVLANGDQAAYWFENVWHVIVGNERWLANDFSRGAEDFCQFWRRGCGPCFYSFACGESFNENLSPLDFKVKSENKFCKK